MEMTSDQKREIMSFVYGSHTMKAVLEDWLEAVIDTVPPVTKEEFSNVKQLANECLHRAALEKDFRQAMDAVGEARRYLEVWTHLLQQATRNPGFNSALA